MKKPAIAIDVDEVLVLGAEPILAHLNCMYGRSFTLEGMNEGFMRYVAQCFADNASEVELVDKIEAFIVSDDYFGQPPINGAQETMQKLAQKYAVIALTHRPSVQIDATHRWIAAHFPNVFQEVVVLNMGRFGHNEETALSKGAYCQAHDIELLIDDKVSACRDIAGRDKAAILFGAYPWNQTSEVLPGVVRCKDWKAVDEYFDGQY